MIIMVVIGCVAAFLRTNISAIVGMMVAALGVLHVFFNTYYRITEDEVKDLCSQYKRNFQEAQAWYDGYELVAIEDGRKKTYSMYSPNVGLVRTEQYDKNNVLQSYTVLEELK